MCALAAILFIPPGLEIGEMGMNDDGHRVQHHDAHRCLRKSAMGRQAIAARIYPAMTANCAGARYRLTTSGLPRLLTDACPIQPSAAPQHLGISHSWGICLVPHSPRSYVRDEERGLSVS